MARTTQNLDTGEYYEKNAVVVGKPLEELTKPPFKKKARWMMMRWKTSRIGAQKRARQKKNRNRPMDGIRAPM
eukprot:4995762-Pyramimonas_sp.AAC.1